MTRIIKLVNDKFLSENSKHNNDKKSIKEQNKKTDKEFHNEIIESQTKKQKNNTIKVEENKSYKSIKNVKSIKKLENVEKFKNNDNNEKFIEVVDIGDNQTKRLKRKPLSIYVHIPFCESKCKYCSFISGHYDSKIQSPYFERLEQEIRDDFYNLKDREIQNIYFGGGTPSYVEPFQIERIFNAIKETYKISKKAEITIECNPNSATLEKLEAFYKMGFNRVSIGAQSFDNTVLKLLGRKHKAKDIFLAITYASIAGFTNISIDLIIGIKELNLSFQSSIKKALSLGVTHVSAYMLMLEEGTPLKQEFDEKQISLLSEDDCVDQYIYIHDFLKKYGFIRYETSNFALKGFECRHNKNYWQCGDYIGFGVSAHSRLGHQMIANTNSILGYIKQIKPEVENLSLYDEIEIYIMLGLRTNQGIKFKDLFELGYNIIEKKGEEIELMKKNGIISVNKNGIKINSSYYGISNEVIVVLIPDRED